MTYNELQTAVANYFKRSDLSSRIVTAIEIAESWLFREISVKEIALVATGTTTDGLITLPDDFGDVIRLTMTKDGVERNLDYVTSPDDYSAGSYDACYYSFQGSQLRTFPNSGTGTAYTLYYSPKIQHLSGSVTTNWLLDNAQDLYLYASCLKVATDIKDNTEIAKLTPMVSDLLGSVRNYADRWGQPKSARLQVKVRR